jgi:hypothetical protein
VAEERAAAVVAVGGIRNPRGFVTFLVVREI